MSANVVRVNAAHPEPELIAPAGEVIRRGGIVAFPTETVYGLAADAFNTEAIRRIFAVKGRPDNKPLPVQVADISDIEQLVSEVTDEARRLLSRFCPGPLTIILPAASSVPDEVTAATGTIGIRIPDHPVALALIRAAGLAIVAPSANPSDEPPPTTADEVAAYFNERVDMILDAGPSQIKTASTVVDLTHTVPVILRKGEITEEQIHECLRG